MSIQIQHVPRDPLYGQGKLPCIPIFTALGRNWRGQLDSQIRPDRCCWSPLYNAILRSRADSLRSHVLVISEPQEEAESVNYSLWMSSSMTPHFPLFPSCFSSALRPEDSLLACKQEKTRRKTGRKCCSVPACSWEESVQNEADGASFCIGPKSGDLACQRGHPVWGHFRWSCFRSERWRSWRGTNTEGSVKANM